MAADVRLEASLRLRLPDAEAARIAAAALAPDDPGYARVFVQGPLLEVHGEGAPLAVLRTLDDVLACLRALGHERAGRQAGSSVIQNAS